MRIKIISIVALLLYILLTLTPGLASDHLLNIFGNANMDDAINEKDIDYVKGIIDGTKNITKLADSNCDGKIDDADIDRIKHIINGDEKELIVIDMAGRSVAVSVPIERLIVTHREQFEQLRAIKIPKNIILSAESQIRSTNEYKVYFAEYQNLLDVGSGSSPNVEAILGLHPDLVLMGSYGQESSQHSAALDVFKSAGIPVVYAHENETNFKENIRMLGYLFGKTNEAEEYIDWRDRLSDSISMKVEDVPLEDKPKVYVEWWEKYTTKDELATRIDKLGGKDIFGGKITGAINPEEIVKQNPDIIVIMGGKDSGYATDNTTVLGGLRDELMSRVELQNVTAIKNGRVYVMSVYLTGTGPYHGGRDFIQEAYLAKWFNPTYFEDFDPRSIHQEYLTKFQGLQWDLTKHGVYVYPPESSS